MCCVKIPMKLSALNGADRSRAREDHAEAARSALSIDGAPAACSGDM
jgi:hypothetical protein